VAPLCISCSNWNRTSRITEYFFMDSASAGPRASNFKGRSACDLCRLRKVIKAIEYTSIDQLTPMAADIDSLSFWLYRSAAIEPSPPVRIVILRDCLVHSPHRALNSGKAFASKNEVFSNFIWSFADW
jgi:hypothetical protein